MRQIPISVISLVLLGFVLAGCQAKEKAPAPLDPYALASADAAYDRGDREGRSLPRHETWLAGLPCPVLRIEGAVPLETSLNRCLTVLAPKS